MRSYLPLVTAIACAVVCGPTQSSGQNSNASLRGLESADWHQRAAAFAAIDKNPHAWQQPRLALSLLSLVEREDVLQKATLQSSNGKVGVSDRFGEEYSEYAARALDECLRYCNRDKILAMIVRDARSGPTRRGAIELLGNAYNRFGFSLSQRIRIDSTLVEATSEPSSYLIRASALSALGEAIRTGNDLPAQERGRLHETAVAASKDPAADVRISAVRRIGEFGDSGDVPLLKRIAEVDSARSMTHGGVSYPTREAARQAIDQIARARRPM